MQIRLRNLLLLLWSFALSSCGGSSDTGVGATAPAGLRGLSQPTYRAVPAFPNLSFNTPVVVTHAGDNRVFVAELAGTVRVFQDDPSTLSSAIFLDLSDRVMTRGERGLLGLAFHPQFSENGFLYVHYSAAPENPNQDHLTVLSRFQVPANSQVADPSSEVRLLKAAQPFSNHNGGSILFGNDGKLYLALGDGGGSGDSEGNAQSLTTVLGKVLRLNDDGSIPTDNPFAGQGGGVREEIFAYGFRNPFRMSVDTQTGFLWLGDVGENRVEEINQVVAGGNYGWNLFEGDLEFDNPTNVPPESINRPIFSYTHDEGQSVTGGLVHRGRELPDLVGRYLFGDFVSGKIWALTLDGARSEELFQLDSPVGFGTTAADELLICSLDGQIYRLVFAP